MTDSAPPRTIPRWVELPIAGAALVSGTELFSQLSAQLSLAAPPLQAGRVLQGLAWSAATGACLGLLFALLEGPLERRLGRAGRVLTGVLSVWGALSVEALGLSAVRRDANLFDVLFTTPLLAVLIIAGGITGAVLTRFWVFRQPASARSQPN